MYAHYTKLSTSDLMAAPQFLVFTGLLLQAQIKEFAGLKNLDGFSNLYLVGINELQGMIQEILKPLSNTKHLQKLQNLYQPIISRVIQHAPVQMLGEAQGVASFFTSVAAVSPFVHAHSASVLSTVADKGSSLTADDGQKSDSTEQTTITNHQPTVK